MIRFLLLHRIEDTDKHQDPMLALMLVALCIALCFAPTVTP